MAKHKNVAQVGEVQAAQAFLKAIGANYQSNDLIYTVVAWMRTSEGGKANLWGNNPFLLRPRDARYISKDLIAGTKSRAGRGTFLVFDSLTAGLKALAQVLLAQKGDDALGYGLIIRAFKQGNPIDSQIAIAMSAWDAAHYGFDMANPDSQAAAAQTAIYKVYLSFTGLELPDPKQPKPHAPVPRPPRDLPSPPPPYPYIDPGAAGAFYRDRHRTANDFLD